MSENLPSIDDFTEDNSKLPSIDDIIKEENLPSVEEFIEEEKEDIVEEKIEESVEEETKPKGPNTVNNALFVGSTAELAKMIKESDLSSSSK